MDSSGYIDTPFRGYCPECKTRTEGSLDSHMMCCHLGLGQVWRCPVEWCAVWKGSVRECRYHFNDKHSGSATLDFEEVSKSFPAWTVTREFWEQALKPEISGIAVDVRLFHESGSCFRSLTGQWLSPSLHIYGLRFHHRAIHRGKCQATAFRRRQKRVLRRSPDE